MNDWRLHICGQCFHDVGSYVVRSTRPLVGIIGVALAAGRGVLGGADWADGDTNAVFKFIVLVVIYGGRRSTPRMPNARNLTRRIP